MARRMYMWESCDVVWDFSDPTHTNARFWANARREQRTYKLAQGSRPFQLKRTQRGYEANYDVKDDEQTREVLDELVAHLTGSGWQAVLEEGPYWWSRSFRREVAAG